MYYHGCHVGTGIVVHAFDADGHSSSRLARVVCALRDRRAASPQKKAPRQRAISEAEEQMISGPKAYRFTNLADIAILVPRNR
jgi:hypothetical protein